MDHEKLRTASTYLNNLLLARGLLRDAAPIDFVKPTKDSRAQIINLVHDLVLREDRSTATREALTDTLRALRADESRRVHDLERQTQQLEDAVRATEAAKAGERVAREETRKLTAQVKALQEANGKLKIGLAQVKAQCATDVRKRDLELSKLRAHLQGQQRGTGGRSGAVVAPSFTVKTSLTKVGGKSEGCDVRDPEYSLKQESTEFLTELSRGLSEENDLLIGLIRSALSTMKELLGVQQCAGRYPDSGVGSMGSNDNWALNGKQSQMMLQALPTSHEILEKDMHSTLGHLKSLLTNPNFVSVDEVEVREEEIVRLREGWERMEQRWRDVLKMMEDWRQRMSTGEAINMDDLRRGIGMVSPEQMRHTKSTRLSDLPMPEQSFVESDISNSAITTQDDVDQDMDASLQAPVPPKHTSPLRNSTKRKRDMLDPPASFDLRPPSANNKTAEVNSPLKLSSLDVNNFLHIENSDSEDLELPRLTVAEKLSATREEAEEAIAARRTSQDSSTGRDKAARKARRMSFGFGAQIEDDTLGKMPSPIMKRTKIRGRPRKRKSTLSPDELEALMQAED